MIIKETNQKLINLNQLLKKNFDRIIISPGIDILNCKLSKFFKKNFSKIYTDLDVFYSIYRNTQYSHYRYKWKINNS